MRALIIVLLSVVVGCAAVEPKVEQRTQVVEVKIPIVVPCFTEADRPILPPLTVIDIDNATTDQLAAALAADDANEANYVKAVDALFLQCQKSTGSIK